MAAAVPDKKKLSVNPNLCEEELLPEEFRLLLEVADMISGGKKKNIFSNNIILRLGMHFLHDCMQITLINTATKPYFKF
jgi:hypothetical protein